MSQGIKHYRSKVELVEPRGRTMYKLYKYQISYLANFLIACVCFSGLPTYALGTPIACTFQDDKDTSANVADGENYHVKVDVVQPFRTSDGRLLFRISYRYNFKDRQTIKIKGVGLVPANGNHTRLFEGQYLDFEDISGNLIVRVRLKPNKKAPESGALDLPKESEFVNFLSDTSQDPVGFLPKTFQKLNNWFPGGYVVRQEGQVTSLVTVYREVEGLPANLRGQIAIRLSYPYDPNNGKFFFRVYTVIRQRPKKSADWLSATPATQKVFDVFAKQLLNDLKK
jgi:hypothetical protein